MYYTGQSRQGAADRRVAVERISASRHVELHPPHSTIEQPNPEKTAEGARMSRIISREQWIVERKLLMVEAKEFARFIPRVSCCM
jgi:hypothetical protein